MSEQHDTGGGPDAPASTAIAVVVLAAGRGSRLAALGTGLPKWLATVGGRPIADYQLSALEAVAAADDRLLVVAGYRVDAVEAWLADRVPAVHTEVLHNPRYAELNNWYSLLLALRRLRELAWSAPVLVLNSDLCAQPHWYADFITAVRSESAAATVAVDLERPLTEEAMKVVTIRVPAGLLCARIGKRGLNSPDGEYVGMAGFTAAGWTELTRRLEGFVGRAERADEWYEAAFDAMMRDGWPFQAWPTSRGWVEIDDLADFSDALQLMARP